MAGECLYDEDDFLTISCCDTLGAGARDVFVAVGFGGVGCGFFEFTIEVVKVIIIC